MPLSQRLNIFKICFMAHIVNSFSFFLLRVLIFDMIIFYCVYIRTKDSDHHMTLNANFKVKYIPKS